MVVEITGECGGCEACGERAVESGRSVLAQRHPCDDSYSA